MTKYLPLSFLCPILKEIMTDPVTTPCGQTYERSAIQQWIQLHHNCPYSRQPLNAQQLFSNLALKEMIEEYHENKSHQPPEPQEPPQQQEPQEPPQPLKIKVFENISTEKNQYKTWIKIESPDIQQEETAKLVVLCLDISGSMDSLAMKKKNQSDQGEIFEMSLLEILIHAAKTVIQCCKNNHFVGIVVFSDSARIGIPITRADLTGKQRMMNYLNQLHTEGCTNLYDGIRVSLDAVKTFHEQNSNIISSIVLFTDGEPSENYAPSRGYLYQMQRYKISCIDEKYPAPVNIFTCGNNVDSKLSDEISRETGGAYSFISDATLIGDILEHYIAGFQCTRIQNAILEIKTTECVQKTIIVGNIQYGQDRDILLEDVILECHFKEHNNNNNNNIEQILWTKENKEFYFHEMRYNVIEQINEFLKNNQNMIEIKFEQTVPQEKRIENILFDYNGQIKMATNSVYYNDWGMHYLFSIRRAYELQQCNNYKDISVQHYGGKFFNKMLDEANDTFMSLPMIKKTQKSQFSYSQNQPANQPANQTAQIASITTASQFNSRINDAGCFYSKTMIQMWNHEIKKVCHLQKGDCVLLANGSFGTIECLMISMHKNAWLVQLSENIFITEYHPIRQPNTNNWIFPRDVHSTIKYKHFTTPIYLYSIVLSEKTNFGFVSENNVEIATLGHCILNQNIISHCYWGTEIVIDQLKKSPNYKKGRVFVKAFVKAFVYYNHENMYEAIL